VEKITLLPKLVLLPKPGPWRAVLVALATLLGIGAAVLYTWYELDQHQQREQQHRFELNTQALGELMTARMQAYEMVLRGVSSAFAGDGEEVRPRVSWARWDEIMEQLQLEQLYPGISSVAWSRRLRADELDEFIALVRADSRPGYRAFPEGKRDTYQLLEHIGPLNAHTRAVWGLDLLTQPQQKQAITQAMDSGQVTLSQPLSDLYVASPEAPRGIGALMYLPLYQYGRLPQTLEVRRTLMVGMVSLAFRGDELAEGVFGSRLRLFHIAARDVETGLLMFDSAARAAAALPGWQPLFSEQIDLPLYGRTWRLNVTSTPEYERAMLSRSQDLVLLMGLSTAVLVALLAGAFVWLRDRQMYASQKVSERLREQADQLLVANRYKSEFLANMSHELRTPLNSILILSDQLRQNSGGNLSEKQTRHADIVYRAGSDLLQLINDVLDLAKIEAGRMQISLEPLNLQDILVDMDAAMRPLAEAKKLALHIPQIAPGSGVPQRVETDRVRLHQILRNLLSNAIKFTDAGTVRLEVSAGKTLKDGRILLHFAVRDTGIGIAPEHHEQVFEAFQQLDGSTRRRFGGTGLGLVITRQLAQALDGEITLQSTLGEGSTFTVSLPMQCVPELAQERAAPQRGGEGAPLLIVEDDPNFAAVIIEQAHAHGFSSVHCTSGQQALELLRTEPFAAVILDILLPDVSGWQLFRRMRALPAHRQTPVHIISCLPQPGGLGAEHGTHYLTKPIGRDALEQVFSTLQQSQHPSHGSPLLLVEDVAEERDHYRQQLAALGFAVTTAGTAKEACAAWAKGQFDVLVVDLSLPDGDGFTLLERLDALRPLRGTRIVVNTGLDVAHEGVQRLHGYSAVVVTKNGGDTRVLGQAVQGFLDQVGLPAAGAFSTDARPSPPQHTLHGRRLLLVDDDVRNVYAMSALLDGFGLDVTTAGNGEEAIACFREQPLDLILMDMSMPVMDGYTATSLLKTEHGCTIPVIALTAHAMKGDREKCLAAGADDYMAKPVKSDELRALLERWLLPPDPSGT